jgi:hypothetical protein
VNVTVFVVDLNAAVTDGLPVRLDAVEKLKLAVLTPVGTVADGGTTSPTLVDDRETAVGEPGPVRVMVQVPPEPATILVGLQVSDLRRGAAIKERVTCTDDVP